MPFQKTSPPFASSSHPTSVTTRQKTPNTFAVRVKTSIPQRGSEVRLEGLPSLTKLFCFLVFPKKDSGQATAQQRGHGVPSVQPQEKHPQPKADAG